MIPHHDRHAFFDKYMGSLPNSRDMSNSDLVHNDLKAESKPESHVVHLPSPKLSAAAGSPDIPHTFPAMQLSQVAEVIDQIRCEIHNINSTLRQNRPIKSGFKDRSTGLSESEKNCCKACTNAASRISTRPNSSSTPYDDIDNSDKTRNLMGKYNWNRTI